MSYELEREVIEHYLDIYKFMNQLVWVDDGELNEKTGVMKWKIKETVYIPNELNPEEIDEELTLYGSVTMKRVGILLKLSLVLKHPSGMIERADKHGPHRNPNRQIIPVGHKHEISVENRDDFAFVPDDVNWDDKPDDIIRAILKEWNIDLKAMLKKPSSYVNVHQQSLNDFFPEVIED